MRHALPAAAIFLILTTPSTAAPQSPARTIRDSTTAGKGVDLGIADDETYKRPNSWSQNRHKHLATEQILLGDASGAASRPGMSIAWRNAAQIEEVEVRVRNLGDEAGEGRVHVDVLGEAGEQLLHLEPPDDQRVIRVPAFERGGREGKILRMKASRELNNIIDRYDREHRRYDVRATVETVGQDANPFDNAKTKSWNVPFGVRPGYTNVYNYVFKNTTDKPAKVRWLFEHTPYPPGWNIDGVPISAAPFTLQPGEERHGTLSLRAPTKIEEGAFTEARISLVDTNTGRPFAQHEWFQVYDTIPPDVSNYRAVFTADHRIAIQVLVGDKGSGVLEATGVTTEYSTDGGRTWSTRAHNYKSGNFVRPTLFEAVLGPFAPGTDVQLRLTAKDTAGNVTSTIPADAIALEVPPPVERLLETAYIFPRTQPNPIFELASGDVNLKAVVERAGADMNTEQTRAVIQPMMAELDARPPAERQVKRVELQRITAPADDLLHVTTLRVKAR